MALLKVLVALLVPTDQLGTNPTLEYLHVQYPTLIPSLFTWFNNNMTNINNTNNNNNTNTNTNSTMVDTMVEMYCLVTQQMANVNVC